MNILLKIVWIILGLSGIVGVLLIMGGKWEKFAMNFIEKSAAVGGTIIKWVILIAILGLIAISLGS